jgi:hypothetical protein
MNAKNTKQRSVAANKTAAPAEPGPVSSEGEQVSVEWENANVIQGEYHSALVCYNGHVISSFIGPQRERTELYCPVCGVGIIGCCPSCPTRIRGPERSAVGAVAPYKCPAFCHGCGKPYPWTEKKIEAAKKWAQESWKLTQTERNQLEECLDHLICDTPQATVATKGFKMLVAKAGKTVADGFRDLLVEIVSESVKKQIWP